MARFVSLFLRRRRVSSRFQHGQRAAGGQLRQVLQRRRRQRRLKRAGTFGDPTETGRLGRLVLTMERYTAESSL